MRLRLGLIGLSNDWSHRHLPALRTLQDRFEVAGVYSSVAAFAESVAREFKAKQYDGFRELLRRDDIDAAMMLESDWYGIAPVTAACDFGKAVYCGSEIDFDPEQASELKRIVDQAGIAFVAEFPRRYSPASLRLKELIATRLGEPQLLFCHKRLTTEQKPHQRNGRSLSARADRELMELIDWCSFIVGRDIRSVYCTEHRRVNAGNTSGGNGSAMHAGQDTGHNGSAHDQQATGQVDYQSLSVDLSAPDQPLGSTIAQISCGTYIPPAWHEAIAFRPPAAVQVCCQKGLAFVDLPNSLVWFDEAGRHQESLESELAVGQQLLTQFHRSVTSLVRKMGDLEDVYRSLTAVRAAKQSAKERRCIHLDPTTP